MAVNWERHLLRIEGKRGEVRALFPLSEFVTDHVFLTKEGELGCVIRVDPISFESLDDADLEHKTAMFVAALGNLDATMRVYQYVTKHGDPDLPVRVPSARTRFLEENKERLFSMETHWAVVYEVERPGNKNRPRSMPRFGWKRNILPQ